MSRLIVRLTLWLLPAGLFLSGAALVTGRQAVPEDVSNLLLSFQICPLPCWGGVTPGITPPEDTAAVLAENLSDFSSRETFNGSVFYFGAQRLADKITGITQFSRGRLRSITLNVVLPLFTLIELAGEPDCIYVWPTGQKPDQTTTFVLYWRMQRVYIRTLVVSDQAGRMKVDAVARNIDFYIDEGICQDQQVSWIGFAPAWRYLQQ